MPSSNENVDTVVRIDMPNGHEYTNLQQTVSLYEVEVTVGKIYIVTNIGN